MENSLFWTTGGAGDGASAYTQAQVTDWLRRTFLSNAATEGVLAGYANGLAVSGTSSPVATATGAAVVYGFPYENTATVSLTVPTPTIGTTGHRVVLRANWTARTVRIALVSSSNGVAAPPALTQSAGTTWEISLATLTITTGGVITVTDTRAYAHPNLRIGASQLDDDAVTAAKIAAGTVGPSELADAGVTQAKLGTNTLRWLHVPFVKGPAYVLRTSTTYGEPDGITFPDARPRILLNGSKLPAGCRARFRVQMYHASGQTAYARLYNVTDGVALTSSEVAITFPALQSIYGISGDCAAQIAAGEKEYCLQVASTSGSNSVILFAAELLIDW